MDFLLQNRVERRRAHRHKSLVLYLFYSIRKKKNYPINDGLNRPQLTTYVDGTTQKTEYDAVGHVTAKVDQASKRTEFTPNCFGQVTSVKQITSMGNLTTSFIFDQVGNELSQTDANSPAHTTTFQYDVMNRRTKRTLPDGRSESYTSYDQLGNLTNKTDFAGNPFTYGYDPDSHLTSVSGPVNLGYTYDGFLRRQSMTDPSGTTTFNYDSRDRLAGQTSPSGWGSLTFTNFATGQVNTVLSSNSNGNNLTYQLDALNRASKVFDGVKTTTINYDPVGNSASVVMADGVTMAYAVNSLNRVTGVTLIGGSGVFGNYQYTLGAAGNKTGVTELSGRAVTWTPDDLYRLTDENILVDPSGNTGDVAYVYDNVGNRNTRTSGVSIISTQNFSGGYNPADLLKPTFNFDQNGNQLNDAQGRIYTYNALNQLTHVTGTGVDVSYVYDGDGLRVQKTNNLTAVTTRYLWDRNNLTRIPQVSEELQGGSVVRRYVYGPRGPLYQVQNTGVSWVTNYFVPDATGSIRLVLDDSGNITDALDYDGFGNILRRTGTTNLSVGFKGEYTEPETGLVYLRARWYNPDLGRFQTMDDYEGTTDDPLSLHKYEFVADDPINKSDPSGNQYGSRIGELLAGNLNQGVYAENFIHGTKDSPGTTVFHWLGSTEYRTGNIPWRDNNPGDITWGGGGFARGEGAIGKDVIGTGYAFAIFPNASTGDNAMHDKLLSPQYQGYKFLEVALYHWNPDPTWDATAIYRQRIEKDTGLSGFTKMSTLGEDDIQNLMASIKHWEGYPDPKGFTKIVPGP